MQQKAIEGYKILMIRNVPPGAVLNKDTAKEYPLIECGTWISEDNNWMIQQSFDGKGYMLVPIDSHASQYFFNRTGEVVGTIEDINKFITEYKASLSSQS
jgi:hypothetical protein